MYLSKLLYILGVLFILWAVVSGLNIQISSMEGEFTSESSYTFKIGTVIAGSLMIVLARKVRGQA